MKSFWQSNTKLPTETFDLAIVGGGIAGLSVAFWATRLGLKCLVLEKGDLGEGASGRNAGFLTGGSLYYFVTLVEKYGEKKALELWRFTTENVALMKEKLEFDKVKDQIDYHASGTVSLFSSNDDLQKIEMGYKLLKENSFDIDKVDSILDFERSYRINTDASYNPQKVILHLAQQLFRTTICTQTTCIKMYKKGSDFEIETNKGIVKSKKVVVSTNAHIGKLVSEMGTKVSPVRAQISYLKLNADKLSLSNYSIPSERIYFRKFGEGIIMGGLRYLDSDTELTDEVELNEKIQTAIVERCQKYFGEVELIQKWSGIMGFTEDEQPVYGATKSDKDFLYIGGFSGHGNGYAFKMAKNLVDEYLQDMI